MEAPLPLHKEGTDVEVAEFVGEEQDWSQLPFSLGSKWQGQLLDRKGMEDGVPLR